ncbi:MAG: leucine-rich repeat domain-containing protein [Spirochaetaceae bacterium]|jgi:hypothetical protein|nr:leucine-rich repeat domain-containing protein [Spirochaetaceae bacterium]
MGILFYRAPAVRAVRRAAFLAPALLPLACAGALVLFSAGCKDPAEDYSGKEAPAALPSQPAAPSAPVDPPSQPAAPPSQPAAPSAPVDPPSQPAALPPQPADPPSQPAAPPSAPAAPPSAPPHEADWPDMPPLPSGEWKTVTDLADIRAYLNSRPSIRYDDPHYLIKVNGLNLGDSSSFKALYDTLSRYAVLDLTESTGTEIPFISPGSSPGNRMKLSAVFLPDSITVIQARAFEGFSSLKTIAMPGVTHIESSAFNGLNGLETVYMPSVTAIGDNAFSFCSKLQSIVLGPEPPALGQDVFKNFYTGQNDFAVYIPPGSLERYRSHPDWAAYPESKFKFRPLSSAAGF